MKMKHVIGALAICMVAGTAAAATYTTIIAPPGTEATHLQIMKDIYGGTWVASGLDFSNGTVSAMRIKDFYGTTPIDIFTGGTGNMDQVWQDGSVTITAEARFAGYSQKFGYFKGSSGGSYMNLFDVTGSGYNPGGSVTGLDMSAAIMPSTTWRWGRSGDGGDFSSLAADNSSSTDRMVTYKITGLAGTETTWLLFWEDKTDMDYNDLVVEVTTVGGGVDPVPEPLTMISAFLAIGGLGSYIRRRTGRAAA